MPVELPRASWRWLYTAESMITDYQEGQAENKTQHNANYTGIPRTGKNHTKKVKEEWGISTDNLKTIFPHASKPGHLQEILQFMVPFGYFQERDASQELEGIRENIQDQKYDEHVLSHEDLDGIELMPVDERINTLQDLIEEEDNQAIKSRLREALSEYEEMNMYLEMWKQNILQEAHVPQVIKNAYKEWDEESESHKYTLGNSFNVQVLTPISSSMPQGIEYPDFFKPYAIPVDDFKKWDFDESLRIIFGNRNYDSYRTLFDKVVQVGNTEVTDLKAPKIDAGRPHVDHVQFGEQEWEILSSESDPTQVLDRFKMAWTDMFNKKGIICGSDFEHDLRSQLKDLLLDKETDVIVLYTGFLQNTGIKKFVMTHFMQTYESIIDNLTPREERKIDRKFVIDILESQLIIQRRTEFNKLTQQDKQFNSFMSNFIEQSAHINTDVWADAKPNTVNPLLPANSEHTFITKVGKEDWEDLFKNLDTDLKRACRNAFQNQDYSEMTPYGKGFLLLTEGRVVDWKKPEEADYFPGQQTYGYRHVAPRMTAMRPVPFSNDDPSFFTEDLGFKEAGRTILFDEYVENLLDKWQESDKTAIELRDEEIQEEREERREEQESKKDLIKQSVNSRLETLYAKKGLPDNWSDYLEQIKNGDDKKDAEPVEFKMRTLEKWTKDLRDDLEEREEMQPEEDLDHREVAEELKRDLKFVFGAKSGKRKYNRAVDYIKQNYETTETYAEEIADKSVDKAMTDLEFEGVIDSSHNVLLEGDSREEKIEKFQDQMSWSCSCGSLNEWERTVCKKCEKHVSEVDEL